MKKKIFKRAASLTLAAAVAVTGMGLTGCDTGSSGDQVIIYSNADEEAITAMENALDSDDEYLLCRECPGSELYVPGSDIRCRYDR